MISFHSPGSTERVQGCYQNKPKLLSDYLSWKLSQIHALKSKTCSNKLRKRVNKIKKVSMRRLTGTSRITIQTKTSILHTQVVQDSCQSVRMLFQISRCFSQFGFKFSNHEKQAGGFYCFTKIYANEKGLRSNISQKAVNNEFTTNDYNKIYKYRIRIDF